MKNTDPIPSHRPVSVAAPIVLDAHSRESVQPLFDYIGGLRSNSFGAISAAEGKRLAPYFDALSTYLKQALNALTEKDAQGVHKPEELKRLTTPDALAGLFNAAAARTRNNIISDVAILPEDITSSGLAKFLFDSPRFAVGYGYGGHKFKFGFLQVYEGGEKKGSRGSTSFPVLLIDKDMMGALAPYAPVALLKSFQQVMSWVNHDMLHHFTSPIINATVAPKFHIDQIVSPEGNAGPVHVWHNGLPGNGITYYEEWAQMGHEKTMLAPGNADQLVHSAKLIGEYFDELDRIGVRIAKSEGAEKAHASVDFFGMLMAHALTRVFPLNHPVMGYCLERLEKADPLPQQALADAKKMVPETPLTIRDEMRNVFSRLGLFRKPPPKPEIDVLRTQMRAVPALRGALKSYKDAGLDILPDENAKVGYRNLKLAQLLIFSYADIAPHIPQPADRTMAGLREQSDRLTLGMIRAAAASYNYTPK